MRHPPRSVLLAGLALAAAPLALPALAQGPGTRVELVAIDDVKPVVATVESRDTAQARARIGGTLEALAVDEGSRVEAGQVLAVVSDPKIPLQLAALDARLDSLAAQQRQAELDLKRTEELRRSGAATQARLDEVRTALDVVAGQIAAVRAERAVVEQQQREGAVLAPTGGRVLRVLAVAGSVLMPGEPVATIADETYVLRLRLPERHARFMAVGDRVQVGGRGLGGSDQGLTPGTVRQVYPELAAGQVVADVSVDGLGDFFVGERVEVLVSTGTRPGLVLPEGLVRRRAGVDLVILAGGGTVPVQLGRPVAGGVEVLSGLRPGDVVLAPADEGN